uniref:Cysteine sulfinate desulfinase/cysteine desulfurase and related enzymes n=1 Tax=Zea mays TaxID=4577 RepID=B6U7J5_MAIZE|nr:cysteine sulfinate desulfinase/cysteine desulfurase and related enzymes [Zea mays]
MTMAGSCAAVPVAGLPSLRTPMPTHLRLGGFMPCSSAARSRGAAVLGCALGARKQTPGVLNQLLCRYMRRDGHEGDVSNQGRDGAVMFGPDDDGVKIPTQVETLVKGTAAVAEPEYKQIPDVDYLQELLAIQQQGPRAIGFFGTRNMGFMHQQLIEILSYAMVITKNHIFTSGASGTNAAVIRGALRAEKPELLTVILPQSLKKQPPESQELLSKVQNLIEKPQYDHLPLIEASRLCNMDIISKVQQVICFAFHDSKLLMETCQEAKNLRKIVTLFYLD